MPIIDGKLIEGAIKIATPAIKEILETRGAFWGPKYVAVVIMMTAEKFVYNELLGTVTDWAPEWGERLNLRKIAEEKASISARTQIDTGNMVYNAPWLFLPKEHLYAGGVSTAGISIGVSGAKEYADEGIARIILMAIIMLAKLKVAKKRECEDDEV